MPSLREELIIES